MVISIPSEDKLLLDDGFATEDDGLFRTDIVSARFHVGFTEVWSTLFLSGCGSLMMSGSFHGVSFSFEKNFLLVSWFVSSSFWEVPIVIPPD